jgi:hypothetical protein
VLTESLSSNERLLWLHYSGFQASCQYFTSVSLKEVSGWGPGTQESVVGAPMDRVGPTTALSPR